MFSLLTASLLIWSADAMLFPLSSGKEPEPELLIRCPPPAAPQYGSISCEYSLFRMKCTAMCERGFQFETGSISESSECDLFEGRSGATSLPVCVRVDTPSTTAPLVTEPPVITGYCVQTPQDCINVKPADYQFCGHCRMFVTCSGGVFYIRQCPGFSVYDSNKKQCVDHSLTCSGKTK